MDGSCRVPLEPSLRVGMIAGCLALLALGQAFDNRGASRESTSLIECRKSSEPDGGPAPTPQTLSGLAAPLSGMATCGGVATFYADSQRGALVPGGVIRSRVGLVSQASEPLLVHYLIDLRDQDGTRSVARSEYGPAVLGPGDQDTRELELPLPADLPAGEYGLIVGTTWKVRLGPQLEPFGLYQAIQVE